ncbi:transcriptional regulator [Shewanella hanedai]|uniref:Winged helix-turn-helix transcriptional regulator n=1 Tax=Shewanella hanedai TaxID=25 RepID=A0A553JS31_SHEHA|nr:winged helix-turn-helix domain-containing protein [Shewanella hanedai]TRY15258.1 winged helix-turn-helix transcriptional regulator [Shewanella hanedai]GGI73463.1 transcriptional regulator [Shewanella hanedai]
MEPNISFIASLIGDSARSRMLMALLGGKALTATELAVEADITPQTASSHLSKLVDGKLLVVRKQGRHKYFQLQGLAVAELLEKLLNITSSFESPMKKTGPDDQGLRKARVCYDHLAGEFGVALYDALAKGGYIIDKASETMLTEKGLMFFNESGVNVDDFSKHKRPICKSCLDWSERRNHLAGLLGQWILMDIFNRGWATKNLDSRAILFTRSGEKSFCNKYGISGLSQSIKST